MDSVRNAAAGLLFLQNQTITYSDDFTVVCQSVTSHGVTHCEQTQLAMFHYFYRTVLVAELPFSPMPFSQSGTGVLHFGLLNLTSVDN